MKQQLAGMFHRSGRWFDALSFLGTVVVGLAVIFLFFLLWGLFIAWISGHFC